MSANNGIKARFVSELGAFRLDVDFTAPTRGVTALFGPSGCGKTSVLRCIAGLTRARLGRFEIDGDIWQDESSFRPTHRRPIGYVFQEPSLFPHLSVRGNLLYGAHSGLGDKAGYEETVELLRLGRLLERSPRHLSGGERQRVAIGRALLTAPKLLLMDEPLTALDASSKDEILTFLERLPSILAAPIIYVSHDMSEVERLADRIVLMEAGRVSAQGSLAAMQSDPASTLAYARNASVSLEAVVEAYDDRYGMATLAVNGASFCVPSAGAILGSRCRLRILAGDVSLAVDPPSRSTIVNIVRARILSSSSGEGGQMTVILGLGEDGTGARLIARVTRRSWDMLNLASGLSVFAQIKAVALARPGAGDE